MLGFSVHLKEHSLCLHNCHMAPSEHSVYTIPKFLYSLHMPRASTDPKPKSLRSRPSSQSPKPYIRNLIFESLNPNTEGGGASGQGGAAFGGGGGGGGGGGAVWGGFGDYVWGSGVKGLVWNAGFRVRR